MLLSRAAAVGAVVRPEHGVGQQPIVARLTTPLLGFTVSPETAELGPAIEDHLLRVFGRICLISHPPQSGCLRPYVRYIIPNFRTRSSKPTTRWELVV